MMHGIEYYEAKPVGIIQFFVANFWYYANISGATKDYIILPDGCFDLIAEFRTNKLSKISLTGLWDEPVEVSIPNGTILLAVRFRLPAAEYILNRPLSGFINGEVELPIDFWQIDTLPIADFENFTQHLTTIIQSLAKNSRRVDPRKSALFGLIGQSNGEQSVKELSNSVYWTARQINRYFNQWFGISLKSYCNILRCYFACRQIGGKLTSYGNFYDQSHFIKEIKKYTGVNPKELYKNKNDRFLQLSVVGKK